MCRLGSKAVCGFAVLFAAGALSSASDKPTHPAHPIRGKARAWKDLKPVWEDAGRKKLSFPQEFDVKEVYLDNDDDYFYFFLRLKPSLPERFRRNDATGNVGYFYFDTDDDPATGSGSVQSIAPFFRRIKAQRDVKATAFLGYEYELVLDVGWTVNTADPKPKPVNWVEYRLRALGPKGDFDRAVPGGRATTEEGNGLIAYSEEGLELAVPLKCFNVRGGQKVRILFAENGCFGEKESYSWGTYRIRKSVPEN